MKAYKYKIEISDSMMGYIHGMKRFIDEIYIPDLECWINKSGFWFGEDRMSLVKNYSEIEVSDEDIEIIKKYIEREKDLKKITEKYLGGENG